jgi:hypothetical protein
MAYTCPVCCYPDLRNPPIDFTICPSCGTEFSYDDATKSHTELRNEWVESGARWYSNVIARPLGWDPMFQLLQGGQIVASMFSQFLAPLDWNAAVQFGDLNPHTVTITGLALPSGLTGQGTVSMTAMIPVQFRENPLPTYSKWKLMESFA